MRTLERGSLLIVIAGLIGLGFWFGSRDTRFDRALQDQGKALEETGLQLETQGRSIEENRATIESNRAAIDAHSEELATLRASEAERVAEIASLRGEASALEERLVAAEANAELVTELGETLEAVRSRLDTFERAGVTDGRRISELEGRLEALERERAETDARLERIERALEIDPSP